MRESESIGSRLRSGEWEEDINEVRVGGKESLKVRKEGTDVKRCHMRSENGRK